MSFALPNQFPPSVQHRGSERLPGCRRGRVNQSLPPHVNRLVPGWSAYSYKWTSVSIIMLADFAEYQRRLRRGHQTRPGLGSAPARRLGCAPGLHLGGQWEAWRRVGVVHDADRPTRADNGRVASYSMHIDIDLRIDGNWITRILQSA